MFWKKANGDKHRRSRRMSEPAEFPDGMMPDIDELFVHGDFPGKVLFRDGRFPGKVFIYARAMAPDTRIPWRLPRPQDDDDQISDGAVTQNGPHGSDEKDDDAIQMPRDIDTKVGEAASSQENPAAEFAEEPPAKQFVEATQDTPFDEGFPEHTSKEATENSHVDANTNQPSNKGSSINTNDGTAQDAASREDAIDPTHGEGSPEKDVGDITTEQEPGSTVAGSDLNASDEDGPAPEEPNEYLELELELEPEHAPPPQLFFAQDAMDFDSDFWGSGTLSEAEPDPNAMTEEVVLPGMDGHAFDEIQALSDTWKIVQEADEERKRKMQERISAGKALLGMEDVKDLLGKNPEDAMHDILGRKSNSEMGFDPAPIDTINIVDSTTPEPVSLGKSCIPGTCGDSLSMKGTPRLFGVDFLDCQTYFQGFVGIVLVFYFFRPDKIPQRIRSTCGGMISPYMARQWSWLRLILGFIIVIRLSEWGLPDGLFEVVCNQPDSGRWPQVWYYPDSALPIFAPKSGDMTRERRW